MEVSWIDKISISLPLWAVLCYADGTLRGRFWKCLGQKLPNTPICLITSNAVGMAKIPKK